MVMYKQYYKVFGVGMMNDINTLNQAGLRVSAGYDAKMKMYYVYTKDKRYSKNIWNSEFEDLEGD